MDRQRHGPDAVAPAADAIVAELKAAFPALREERFVPMVNSVQGDEPLQVAADFGDKNDWTVLSPVWLDATPGGLATALSFLSDAAIRFYIPAYLAADLSGALQRADPAFALVHGFDDMSRDRRIWPRKPDTWTDFSRARWDGLTPSQVLAVVHYLEWRVARGGVNVEWDIGEALAAYWYPRAAGLTPA